MKATCLQAAVLALVVSCSGGVENTGGPTPEQQVTSYCSRVAALECSDTPPTEAECLDELRQFRERAVEIGCEALFDDVLRCVNGQALSCGRNVQDMCPTQAQRYGDCARDNGGSGGECAGGSGSGVGGSSGGTGTQCSIDCGSFSATCGGPLSGPVECTCTSGANAGRTFQARDCNSSFQDSAQAACF